MSSDAARVIQNTRERLTSTSLNRTQDLTHKLVLDMIATAVSTGDTGVINGLTLSMPNVNTVEIATGFAQIFDSTVVSPDSQKRLVEVDTTISVGLSAASGVNNRWDGIFISPRSTNLPDVAVDIFDPSTGTFSSQLKPKETENDPLITIVEGAVGTDPAIPLNPGGSPPKIPLGFIYRPTGGAGATTTMLFGARPIMRRVVNDAWAGITLRDSQFVRGGGVNVNSSFVVAPQNCVGSFTESGIIFTLGTGVVVDFADDEYRDQDTLGSVPGSNQLIFWYAHPVPIPIQGAQSEFSPGVDALALLPAISASQENCMILASTTPPDTAIAQGRPTADLRSITTVFGDNVISRDDCIYLGSTDYNNGANEMNQQFVTGAGHIVRRDANHPQSFCNTAGTRNLWTQSGGLLPTTATKVYVRCDYDLDSTGSIHTRFQDLAGEDSGTAAIGITGTNVFYPDHVQLYPDSGGDVVLVIVASGGGVNPSLMHSIAYDDSVLGRR